MCKKICHRTQESADEHLITLHEAGKEHPKRLARLQVYYCRQCAAWHVGHIASPTQRRKAAVIPPMW